MGYSMDPILNHLRKLLAPVVLGLAIHLLPATPCEAQAIYAATRTGHLQAGVGGLLLNTDYGARDNKGLAFWADYDFSRHVGLEAGYRLGGLIAPGGIAEDTFLAGPRVLVRRGRATGYARVMAGRGRIENEFYGQASTFNLYSLGGGVEYKVSRRLNVRAVDFELQKWPDFRPSSLSPTVITIGLSYVIR